MSDAGDGIRARNAAWTFGGTVPEHFDGHVARSVPFYREGHELVLGLSDFFVTRNSLVYDLGAATGTLSLALAERIATRPGARVIGIDADEAMVTKAESRRVAAGLDNADFVAADLPEIDFEPCDFVVAYYTVQFVRPRVRQLLIDRVYQALNWGGCFVLFEKVRGPDARFQDILTSLYAYDFKLAQGYSAEEIVTKARSLKGVLEPFSTQGNLDLLARAGFVDVMSIMKYVCFEGFVAIK